MPSSFKLRYNCALAVDVVLLTVRDGELQILLIDRALSPRKDGPALPGGFVLEDEDPGVAALRELHEETDIDASSLHLEQLKTYGAPDRDPRGRIVTAAYLALAPDLPMPTAGTDAAGARWEPVEPLLSGRRRLAFDHTIIVRDGVERARSKLEYTMLATAFCAPEFTISELRRVYETVWSMPLDPRNFHRKVTSAEFLEPTGRSTTRDGGRPAALYRLNKQLENEVMYPPMLRRRLAP